MVVFELTQVGAPAILIYAVCLNRYTKLVRGEAGWHIDATYRSELSTSWPPGSRFCKVLCWESRVFGEHVESSGLGFSVALLSLVCLNSSQAGHVGTAMDILMSDGGLPSCLKHQSFPIHVDTMSGSMDFTTGPGFLPGPWERSGLSLLHWTCSSG